MRSAFGSRRKARKVGHDEEDESDGVSASADGRGFHDSPTVVKKPAPGGVSQVKTSSKLRLSFGPGEASGDDSQEPSDDIFIPKKSNLSRQAIEKTAARKSLAHSLPLDSLSIRPGYPDDRPSYNADYLNELKSSTPSTPKDLSVPSPRERGGVDDALNVYGKFGEAAFLDDNVIPSQAEIEEKKQRRALLAKEHEFISLHGEAESDDDDDEEENENGEITLRSSKAHAETRLVREDEDLAEGFDEFVEDGRITLGKQGEKEQRRRRRLEMAEMINEAEGSSDEDTDDSDADRRAAYETTQTRAGTYGTRRNDEQRKSRPRAPPKITPLPSLSTVVERLQRELQKMEFLKQQSSERLADLEQEKAELAARETEVQRLLTETGAKYEKVAAEAGLAGAPNGSSIATGKVGDGPLHVHRGLETFGHMPRDPSDDE
ncbi:MAG: hypothetical protein M1838_004920 [Thelocarpon superellum]|nr:MAG: hypothetical protein M1838_004920 [Thelocarpon superellum]